MLRRETRSLNTSLWDPELRRYRQTVDELLDSLSRIQSSWKDNHAESVMRVIDSLPEKTRYGRRDIQRLLDGDFEAGLT